MGKAAVPVSPWLRSSAASALAPAHFCIAGAVRLPVAVGVSDSIAPFITASMVGDFLRS